MSGPTTSESEREHNRWVLRGLPGYPFLPCPICGYSGDSCDHTGYERARAAIPGLVLDVPPPPDPEWKKEITK